MTSKISPHPRVRFAPSPTGYLHVGGARTALYNYLYAKKNGGEFILRIEDTDEARSTEESLRGVVDDLVWLNLLWAEGVDPKTLKDVGPLGPYRQSQRQDIYKKYADQLLNAGKAYYCFLTDEEIEKQREEAKAAGRSPHVNSPYQDWPLQKALEHIEKGNKGVVRFKTKGLAKDYTLNDLVRGEVKFPSDMVGDFVLLRSDGMPVYNFCCVVDDHLMKITHVFRAEEHLPNTLRQMMIYEGLNWPLPEFGHMALILDEDRQKLSKRKGAVACGLLKEEGYLASAVLNFIALLGWSHPEGKEIMSVDDMIQAFDISRLNPSGAIFDRVKFKWMNAQHLRALPNMELWNAIQPFLAREKMELPQDPVWQDKSITVFKPYMEILSDAIELYKPLNDKSYVILPEAEEAMKWESTKAVLTAWKELVSAHTSDYMTEEEFLKIQDEVKNKTGAKGKNLFMPIRVAVIGKPHGAELKILVPLMKKDSLIARAEKALAQL
ncbi:glutamate--tRNA ligase [Bdellovibrio bacteriovorus]|uniref:Glutamate--tRNA ligase n=1 Tax=Bdellovibrio bacteriovorus TaxID=959 RepID=A0A161QFA4_BDEBC|nr:glutamate--tRNA ligase [Bdellovibrio bacteriovorus]KYG63547.1 glutamate--tRNA ligase [Bdellovibrio bacteriovorus]